MGIIKNKKNNKNKELKKVNVEVNPVNEPIEETKPVVVEKKKERNIKVGSKVTVTGRLYGSSRGEAPLGYATEYTTKVLEINKETGMLKTDEGWIFLTSVK